MSDMKEQYVARSEKKTIVHGLIKYMDFPEHNFRSIVDLDIRDITGSAVLCRSQGFVGL